MDRRSPELGTSQPQVGSDPDATPDDEIPRAGRHVSNANKNE